MTNVQAEANIGWMKLKGGTAMLIDHPVFGNDAIRADDRRLSPVFPFRPLGGGGCPLVEA